MKSAAPPLKHVIAVLLATTLALFMRAWLQMQLQDGGMQSPDASSLSYLVVPPILLVVLFPILIADRRYLGRQFLRQDLSLRLVLVAIAVGLLVRLAWWAQLSARVMLGTLNSNEPGTSVMPSVTLDCPGLELLVPGIVVSSILIPIIEELTNRGYVQSYLHIRGPVPSIVLSSVVFMLFHGQTGWLFSFSGGLVLGTMYWLTRSLWAPVICHSVINLTPQLVWRCLNPDWNPPIDALPLWLPGLVSSLVFVLACFLIARLTYSMGSRRGT